MRMSGLPAPPAPVVAGALQAGDYEVAPSFPLSFRLPPRFRPRFRHGPAPPLGTAGESQLAPPTTGKDHLNHLLLLLDHLHLIDHLPLRLLRLPPGSPCPCPARAYPGWKWAGSPLGCSPLPSWHRRCCSLSGGQ